MWVSALVMALAARCEVREWRVQGMRRTLLVCMAVLLSVGGSLRSGSSNLRAAGTQSPSPPPSPSLGGRCSIGSALPATTRRFGRQGSSWIQLTSIIPETTRRFGKRCCTSSERGKCHRQVCRVPTTSPTMLWQTTSKLHSIKLRKPDPILADPPCIASIASSMPTPSATCSRWRSIPRRFCQRTIPDTASTTSATC